MSSSFGAVLLLYVSLFIAVSFPHISGESKSFKPSPGYNNQPGNVANSWGQDPKFNLSGVTYYWGSHQVGESVLAFSKDRFVSTQPGNAFRTISYQNGQCRISYLEVFVRNAVAGDQVYVSHGGIGASLIGVFIGSQSPTTYFEYKATLYGFE